MFLLKGLLEPGLGGVVPRLGPRYCMFGLCKI